MEAPAIGEISVQGKPTIFFSANSADEAWRFKEKIVAVIGSFLQGRDDLYTFSSISVRDIVNDLENLDVAYASIDDPTELFSFIEVRDREKKVGRQYIQEILGKRGSLAIDACEIVSTRGFTRNAKRLAFKVGIPLRLLLPYADLDKTKWYNAPHIGIRNRLASVQKCSIVAKMTGGFQEFKADQAKILDNNILTPTDTRGTYRVVSLSKVFDVEIMRSKEHSDEIFDKIPMDNVFHNATIVYQYKDDEYLLYMHVADYGIVPIAAIVFFVHAGIFSVDAPVEHRFMYIDATNEQELADVVCAEVAIQKQLHYIALVRHSCDGQNCQLGGASFR